MSASRPELPDKATSAEQLRAQRDVAFQWHSLDAVIAHQTMTDIPAWRLDLWWTWLRCRRERSRSLSEAWASLQAYAKAGGTKYE